MGTGTRRRDGIGVCLLALAVFLSVAGGALAAPTADAGPADGGELGPAQPSSHSGLTISPQEIDFDEGTGPLEPGETATRTVTIRNDSPEPINVTRATVTGDTEAFAVTEPFAVEDESDFGDGSVTVPEGFSLTAVVEFAPPAAGSYNASVTLYGDGGSELASVSATGTAVGGPDIAVSPRSVNFQGTAVGQTVGRTVQVTNEGDATLRVSEARIRGDGDYAVASTAPFALEPGASERVTVTFTPESTASQSALLELRSNDPDQPVTAVSLSNSDTQTEVSSSERDGTRTLDVAVRNTDAGERVNVTVPSSADGENETVDVQHIGFVPERGGNVSLNVTDSEEPLATTPPFETGDNATGLRYLNVSKSLSNDDIAEVRYRYRIPKERVAALTSDPATLNGSRVGGDAEAGPDAITMYRHVDGEWVEEETRHVRETPTHHVFVTVGSGFSEWTAAAKQPDISVDSAEANVEAATVGENIIVGVTLVNTGGADGVFDTKLLADGEVREQRQVTVPDNGTVLVSLETAFDEAATYEVTVNGVSAGVVTINEDSEAVVGSPSDAQADEDGEQSGDDTGFLGTQTILMGVGVLVLLAALGALFVAGGDEDAVEAGPESPADSGDVVQVEGYDDGSREADDDGGEDSGRSADERAGDR